MFKNNKASILIYILVLISIVMIMAIVVLNNSIMLENSLIYQELKSELSKKIKEKWSMLADYDIQINTDWGWFIDNISCPKDIIMSWAVVYSNLVETQRAHSWSSHICSWSYNSIQLNIFPNTSNTWFTSAVWWAESINLVDWWTVLVWLPPTFAAYDSWTYIIIPKASFEIPDWIDDDFNSDNYNWD